jgi:hypothetical protein
LYQVEFWEAGFNETGSWKAEAVMTTDMVWKCEQWFGGEIHEQRVFRSEQQAREFAKEIMNAAPDMVLRIEAMPIQNVWN